MTWVIIGWWALILVWMIAGGIEAADTADCADEPTQALRELCEDAAAVGAGLGIAIIGFIGFLGFVALSLIWLMTRPRGRDCPACGETVKKGRTTCPNCDFDLAAAARAGTQPTPPE